MGCVDWGALFTSLSRYQTQFVSTYLRERVMCCLFTRPTSVTVYAVEITQKIYLPGGPMRARLLRYQPIKGQYTKPRPMALKIGLWNRQKYKKGRENVMAALNPVSLSFPHTRSIAKKGMYKKHVFKDLHLDICLLIFSNN